MTTRLELGNDLRRRRLVNVKRGDLVVVAMMGGPHPARYLRPLDGHRRRTQGYHEVALIYPSGVGAHPRPGLDRAGQAGNSLLYAEGKPRRFHEEDIKKARVCDVCGCSDFFPCEGGCSWVGSKLCSRCA